MRRREFVKLLGSAVVAWPLAARAQQTDKLPTIGFLGASSRPAIEKFVAAFIRRLSELGWIEGRTIAIEYRWADGHNERMAEIAAEFVRLKVNIIVAQANAATSAAKKATSTIPIVFPAAGDPVGTGLVASLAQPGGNITGLSIQAIDTAGKRVELLRDVVPHLQRLAIMTNMGNTASVLEMRGVERAAGTLGLQATTIEIQRAEDIAAVFADLRGNVQALYVTGDALLTANRTGICILAASAKLPTAFPLQEFVEAGGLMSYGPNFPEMYRRAADYVDKILHGMKPGSLPVEQPTKFDLVINLTTAKAIGLAIPQSVLIRAAQIIE